MLALTRGPSDIKLQAQRTDLTAPVATIAAALGDLQAGFNAARGVLGAWSGDTVSALRAAILEALGRREAGKMENLMTVSACAL